MTNSADPGQFAPELDLHCLQRQSISGSAGQGLNLNKFSLLPVDVSKIAGHYEDMPIQIY